MSEVQCQIQNIFMTVILHQRKMILHIVKYLTKLKVFCQERGKNRQKKTNCKNVAILKIRRWFCHTLKTIHNSRPNTKLQCLGFQRTSLRQLIKDVNFHAYKPRILHTLNENNPELRMVFAVQFLLMSDENPNLLQTLWWSDEAILKLNGIINRHNCVWYTQENLNIALKHRLNSSGVTVWTTISPKGLIGPFFLDGTVNENNYLDMSKTYAIPQISAKTIIKHAY